MRIALISFEYPPSVVVGGIGTYAWEASLMLAGAGHEVEVFSAGTNQEEPAKEHGILVHRVECDQRNNFRERISSIFGERQSAKPFEIVESPEIGAEGSVLAAQYPEVARVVKLHTPSYLVGRIGREPMRFSEKLRFAMGGLRRGRLVWPRTDVYDPFHDPERDWTASADEVAAPSRSIGEIITNEWHLDKKRVSHFPYPFRPSQIFLDLPVPNEVQTVGFLGRLEPRKGIFELVKAIPLILRRKPELRFRLIGPSWPYRQTDVETWIRRHLKAHLHAVEFVGEVSRKKLPSELERCDAVVLPSRWENFPFACWESMASGRIVIGSRAGGMADVIEDDQSGLVIDPRDPPGIAEAVLDLANRSASEIQRLASNGRMRVREFLDPRRILPEQEASYRRAIEQAKVRNQGQTI